MNIPVASALGRRDRFWPAVTVSAAVHAALVAWAVVRAPPVIDDTPAPMRARLVRLGEKRPETYLPRREEPPAAPEPAPVVAPPVTAPQPAAAAPAAPVPGARPAPGAKPAPGKPAAGGGLAAVLSRVKKEVDSERWGDPDGDAAGDSDVAEGDRYHALVERALRQSYDVPSTISEQERLYLKAVVSLYIEPDGTVHRWRFEERSGNPAFDAALERTLRATRMPPPPEAQREFYRRTGLQVMFKI